MPPPLTIGERCLAPNFELIEAVAHTGNGLVDLWEATPSGLIPTNQTQIKSSIFSFLVTRCFAVAGHVIGSIRVRGPTGTSCKTYSSLCQVQ
jgi:hypothetical protein